MDGRIVGFSYVQSRVEVAACKYKAQNGLRRKLGMTGERRVGILCEDNGEDLAPEGWRQGTAVRFVTISD